MLNKTLRTLAAGGLLAISPSLMANSAIGTAAISAIPNATKSEKSFDASFLSVPGYASLGVSDRSIYIGTPFYRTVSSGREFLQAILEASQGLVKVIEITGPINLGWTELALDSTERSRYSFLTNYPRPSKGFTNPLLIASGVSKLNIANVDGLTIFSTSGQAIKHAEIKLQGSSNDIVIRNLRFDEMWQWDDSGQHKEVGWSFIKINGANNVWIDHCTFSIAADGMIDMENGASNVTLSWNEFGLEADEYPDASSSIHQSIGFMENKYATGALDPAISVYYKMRSEGASVNQIMAYAAYHSKVHLVGSGDKDYTNYISPTGVEVKDGNQRLRLTMAYNRYTNVGQRLPMIRQGTGHVFNNFFDNLSHQDIMDFVPAIARHGRDTLSRGVNARNGASIAADTNVYVAFNEPLIGAERQGDDTGNMSAPFDMLFKDAINHSLIVNSRITNRDGSYTGSSWDNYGDNPFTRGITWHDKSTIGNWAWSSHIVGVESMSKTAPPSTPFVFTYDYGERLPYAYQTVPLNSVVPTVAKYAGATRKIGFGTADWLKISYARTYPVK